MRISIDDLRRAVLSIVQPLRRTQFTKKTGLKAEVKENFGSRDDFVDLSPFGLSSTPGKSVYAYFLNLGGSRLAPHIIGHLHKSRPAPSDGGTVLYATNAAGDTIAIRLTLKPAGTMHLGSDNSNEPLVLGNAYKTLYNAHQHIGNLGVLTGTPIIPMGAAHLSAKAFTEL